MKIAFFIEKMKLAFRTCGYCYKVFPTNRGQKIHTRRMHKNEYRGLGLTNNT